MTDDQLSRRSAVAAGLAALADRQHRSGYFADYRLGRQVSDEYVTAFTAALLAGVGPKQSPRADGSGTDVPAMVATAWSFLAGRSALRPDGGWGWNLWLPADADSTVFGLVVAGAVTDPGGQAERAARFLAGHLGPDGARTYRDEETVARITPEADPSGWLREHACVTAAAAGLGGSLHPELLPALRAFQRTDGSWRGHWWPTSDYPTGIACTALAADAATLARAGAWARSAPEPAGAFDAAWRLTTLALDLAANPSAQAHRAVQRAAARLTAGQRADGTWAPSARMWLPAPHEADPAARTTWVADERGMGAVTVDQNAVVSTVSAVSALCHATVALTRR